MLNGSYAAWTREEVSPRRRPTRRIQNRLDTQLVMKKVAFYSKWLDNPNGSVKNSSNEFMEQNETGTLLLAKPSNSAVGLLARMAKGVVSFLQNLLSPLTQKEGVCAEKVSRLRALSQTTAIGTFYGLLFAGLLLMPVQSHRATAAAPPSEDNYEDQALPVLGIGAVFVIGFVAGYLATAAWDGTKWSLKQRKLPKGKIVAVTSLVEHSHEGEQDYWYCDDKVGQYPMDSSMISWVAPNEDLSWYDFHIYRVAWNSEHEAYMSTGEWWDYFGNGYYPDYSPGTAGIEGDSETGKEGFIISSGYTATIDLMHAFDSVATKSKEFRKLAAEGDPGYDPVAYVDLVDASYTKHPEENYGVWTYTPRTTPDKFTQQMSATISQCKKIDVTPKNTRLDGWEMDDNKSTLTWK